MISVTFCFFFFPVLSFANMSFVFMLADLPRDSNDFEPSMDVTFNDASNEVVEVESVPLVAKEGNYSNDLDFFISFKSPYSYPFIFHWQVVKQWEKLLYLFQNHSKGR